MRKRLSGSCLMHRVSYRLLKKEYDNHFLPNSSRTQGVSLASFEFLKSISRKKVIIFYSKGPRGLRGWGLLAMTMSNLPPLVLVSKALASLKGEEIKK